MPKAIIRNDAMVYASNFVEPFTSYQLARYTGCSRRTALRAIMDMHSGINFRVTWQADRNIPYLYFPPCFSYQDCIDHITIHILPHDKMLMPKLEWFSAPF